MIACLSLTTKFLYRHLGKHPRVVGRLFFDDGARWELLRRIDRDRDQKFESILSIRDLQEFEFLCDECSMFHPALPQNTRADQLRRKCYSMVSMNCMYFIDNFNFGIVHILGRLFRASKDNPDRQQLLRDYLSTIFIVEKGSTNLSKSQPTVIDFRIVCNPSDGNIYIRKQEWLAVSCPQQHCDSKERRARFQFPDAFGLLHFWDVCCHLSWSMLRRRYTKELDSVERSLAHAKLLNTLPSADIMDSGSTAMLNKDNTWANFPLYECESCPSEYRIDFGMIATERDTRKERERILFACMTKWMCLGDGKSRDGLWSKHLNSLNQWAWYSPSTRIAKSGTSKPEFPRGSVFKAFEGHSEVSKYTPTWTTELEQVWKSSTIGGVAHSNASPAPS